MALYGSLQEIVPQHASRSVVHTGAEAAQRFSMLQQWVLGALVKVVNWEFAWRCSLSALPACHSSRSRVARHKNPKVTSSEPQALFLGFVEVGAATQHLHLQHCHEQLLRLWKVVAHSEKEVPGTKKAALFLGGGELWCFEGRLGSCKHRGFQGVLHELLGSHSKELALKARFGSGLAGKKTLSKRLSVSPFGRPKNLQHPTALQPLPLNPLKPSGRLSPLSALYKELYSRGRSLRAHTWDPLP